MPHSLRFNPNNPVTVGLWRERWHGVDAIRKHISPSAEPTHPDWQASEDPHHFLYWKREALVSAEGLDRAYGGHLRAPHLLGLQPHEDGSLDLWLEALDGRTGPALSWDDYLHVARMLGRAQASVPPEVLDKPWLARDVMRQLCASKHYDPSWLESDEAWAHPLVRSWPEGLREGLRWLEAHREALLSVLEHSPRTLCHHDVWAHNLFVEDEVVLIDWAFCGEGALGEDLGHLVAESGLNGLRPAAHVPLLGEAVLQAYIDGLHDVDFDGDEQVVRRAFAASAVKWHWLGPLHLARAVSGEHHDYGGRAASDPAAQYEARGQVLAWAVTQTQAALRG